MRVSEALALRLGDITDDGLVVDKTKFKKSRLLPLHSSTRRALDTYLAARLRVATESAALLIGNTGKAVAYPTVIATFLQLTSATTNHPPQQLLGFHQAVARSCPSGTCGSAMYGLWLRGAWLKVSSLGGLPHPTDALPQPA